MILRTPEERRRLLARSPKVFMVGASLTNISPDKAPVGIVKTIDVSLHELIGEAIPFIITALPFWVAPKCEPVIVT